MFRGPIRFARSTALFALPLSFWAATVSGQDADFDTDFDTDFDIDVARIGVGVELEQSTPLRVLAASGSWYRVRLPNGKDGFVAARLTEAVVEPLRRQFIESASALFSSPSSVAPVMEDVEAGTEVAVLGSYQGFLYVQSPDGSTGWLAGEADLVAPQHGDVRPRRYVSWPLPGRGTASGFQTVGTGLSPLA